MKRMQLSFDIYNPFTADSGIAGPTVLVTAGVHGDEYEPMIAAFELMGKAGAQVKKGKLVIVPVTNTSAYNGCSRYGSDGLDLARICPGKQDGTESERAAFDVSNLIRQADYYIDLHTGGKVLNIYPLSGYMLHSSEEVLQKQQWMAQAFGLPVVWGTDAALNGRTLSVARDAGIPAIYVEYGGGEPFDQTIVESYVAGCLNILAGLKVIAADYRQHGPLYWVEDYTPGKGHLQSKMPSPADGIFIPAVKPGDTVVKGDAWGWVIDLKDKQELAVPADEEGMVLFLRSTSFVQKNDSLGGVLPVTQPGKIKIL